MKYYAPIDLTGNELRNALLHVLGSAPGSPAAGQVYYNSTNAAPYFWNGSAWQVMDATLATGIPITALATNPLARANHTGTQLAATISDFATQVTSTVGGLTGGQIQNTALATNPLTRANHTGTQTASTISNLATTVQAYSLDLFVIPAADISWNSHKITSLATPTNPNDAANKSYVDAAVQAASSGISGKGSVVAVSTTNQASLSGLAVTIDGVALNATGMRVLLTGQTTASQNGPWIIQSGAWTRPTTDANNELETGALFFVEQGTVNAATQWWINSPAAGVAITPGTTSIGLVKYGAASIYTAAVNGGLNLSGGAFNVIAGTAITVTAGGVNVDTTKVPLKFSQTIGDGSTTAIVVTHNLGTSDINVSLREISTNNGAIADWQATSSNTATITFATAPTAGQFRVTITG